MRWPLAAQAFFSFPGLFFMNFYGTARYHNEVTTDRKWQGTNAANSLSPDASLGNPPVAPVQARFNTPGGNATNVAWRSAPARSINWALMCVGPDKAQNSYINSAPTTAGNTYDILRTNAAYNRLWWGEYNTYDPTNGTMSEGDIWRLNASSPDGR